MTVIVVYDWDADKAAENLRKHGISFSEATEVFEDSCRVILDNYHFEGEEPRYQAIGMTMRRALLVAVVYVDRTKTDDEAETIVLRLISARKATKYDETIYYEGRSQA
jgi:uncharacterized DUF497 family protein